MAVCNLCKKEKKLIKAHIIPEFMYQDLYNEDHRFYEFSKADILDGKKLKQFVQIGEFDKNILCAKCDNERIGSLEKYGQKVLFGKKLNEEEVPDCNNYEQGGYEFSECKNVDYLKFKLFILSILWRAHLTDRVKFSSVDLGPHAETIRNMIWESDPGEELEYPILTTSFIRAEYHYSDLILEPRRMRSVNGFNSYIFSIGSFQFNIFVNSSHHKLSAFVNEWTLKKENLLRTIHFKDGLDQQLLKKMTE